MGDESIDWCVAFNGGNVDVLSRALFASLFQCCNEVYTKKVQFHLVDNGGSRLNVNLEYGPDDPTWYTLDENWKPSRPASDYYAESVLTPWAMAEYMVEKCGVNKWCIISHFDIVFKDDVLAWMVERMTDDVGVVGTHCPIMAVNREAYKSRRTGFAPSPIGDYDVGIALERDMVSQGWFHKKFDAEVVDYFTHFGGGAGHHNLQEFNHMRSRAMVYNPDAVTNRAYRGTDPMDQVDGLGRTTTLIHYVFQVDPERVACMPNMVELHATSYHPNYQRSNATEAVTCPGCKGTDAYKQARGRRGA